jgi:RNA polymerase sigma-70 factor (ECF subfamily)
LKPDAGDARSNPSIETIEEHPIAPVPPDATEDAAAKRALVERARARDAAAFRALVDRHRDRAFGLALRITRSAPDAEEVAQDAFVRAWFALPEFRGESSFSTWLHRIVARRALDRAATLARRRGREAPGEEAAAVADPSGRDAAEQARARRLERLIAELPESQRAAVTLFYHEGRSVEQVAATLGIPTGTVKTHLSRARAALRTEWLKQEQEDQG